jgi:hypothetical protein
VSVKEICKFDIVVDLRIFVMRDIFSLVRENC